MRNRPILITGALLLVTVLVLLTHNSAILFPLVTCGTGLIVLLSSGRITKYYVAHPPYEGLGKQDDKLVRLAFISFGIAMLVFGIMAFLLGSTTY